MSRGIAHAISAVKSETPQWREGVLLAAELANGFFNL